MQFGGRREVSLRGASAREVSRNALLNKVAEERAARSKARKSAASAALIQRVWRGRKAACVARQLVQSEWDTWHASRMAAVGGQPPAPLTADEVSQKLLAPVLFLLWDARKREWRIGGRGEGGEGGSRGEGGGTGAGSGAGAGAGGGAGGGGAGKELQRLQSVLVWLLKSLDSPDPATNFCSLAVGTQSQRAMWQHQAHRIVAVS
ncbi:unnamed protein product [Closterium sp. Naga37s-1]|nr:unnamed protein product [Closterium sp. Naga37s-1]